MTLTGLAKGTFSIRAIALTTGNISDLYTETVYAEPELASFDITLPEAIYQNDAATFGIVAVDQYGKTFNVDDPSDWTVTPLSTTISSTNMTVPVHAKNEIGYTITGKGNADLYFTTGSLTVTKSIVVQPEKVISSIASVPVSTEALLMSKTLAFDLTKVVLNDQYGNEIAYDSSWNYDLRRLADTDPLGNTATDTNGTALVLTAPVGTATSYAINAHLEGTDQLQLTIYKGGAYGSTDTNNYVAYTYDFSLASVKAASVVAYELSVKEEMYAGKTTTEMSATHDLAVALIGKTANGTTVTLVDSSSTALPSDTISKYTTTGANVTLATATSKLQVTTAVTGNADGTTTIRAWNNKGESVAEAAVALRRAAPKVDTLTLTYKSGVATLAAKDQYGITKTPPTGQFFSSNSDLTIGAVTVATDKTTVVINGAAGKTAVIRFVSDDGVWAREVSVTK